jgi:uncharacterized membrane protein YebE (DUF533 family)
MNLGDVIGQLMRDGLSPQTQNRIEHAVSADGLGSAGNSPDLGALLGSLLGGQAGSGSASGQDAGSLGAGSLGDVLGSLLGGAQGAGQSAGGPGGQGAGGLGDILGGLGQMLGSDSGVGGMSKGQLGGLGALAGALLGGGSGASKGAIGGSAMALLGTLALTALKNWQAQQSAGDSQAVSLTETEVRQIAAPETAELCLRAMIEAMKSGGISPDEQKFVQGELSKPQDLDGLVHAIPNPEVGIQIYAAALMAISVDTAAERNFLTNLAKGAGLDREAVARLHQMVGAPAA